MLSAASPKGGQRVALWPLLAMLVVAIVATTTPLPERDGAVRVEGQQRPDPLPRVSDPMPAPWSVLAPGPVVVGARVQGAEQGEVGWLVDGQLTQGRFVDTDGQLSDRRGLEVSLTPGVHRLGVRADGHGTLAEWEVTVAGMAIDTAPVEPYALARRTSGRRAVSRPVLLVNTEVADVAALAGPVAATVDAAVVPTSGEELPTETSNALLELGLAEGAPVMVLGGPTVIGDAVVTSLRNAGWRPIRLDGVDPADVAVSAADHLHEVGSAPSAVVVATDAADGGLLRAAATATSVGAVLLVARADGLPPAAEAVMARAETVLASTALTEVQRADVAAALPRGAAISDDPFAARSAGEALVVADSVDAGVAALAVRAAGEGRAVVIGTDAAHDWVAANQPERVTLVGVEDPERVAASLRRSWVDGPDAPRVELLVDATGGLTLTFTADADVTGAQVHVDLLGFQWPGTVSVVDNVATWEADRRPRLPEALEPAGPGTPARIDITARIETGIEAGTETGTEAGTETGTAGRHISAVGEAMIDPLTSISREGFVVAGGSSDVVGVGPLRTFSVEVERATVLDIEAVAAEVEQILLDPRSWTADGTRSLQRIGNSRAADLRVVVARPQTVDAYCGAVGLRTGGRVSCWDGYRAMLNLDRWNHGVVPFHTNIDVYRQYLVNHEFGHGLGYGHVFCPGPGELAPVMMQQTGGLGACRANGWPYPEIGDRPAVG